MANLVTGKNAKKNQTMVAVVFVVGFMALLGLGMFLSDPNAGKPTVMEVAREKEKEAKSNFRVSSGATVEESWVSKSEKRFAGLQEENSQLKRRMLEMNRKLDSLSTSSNNNLGSSSNNKNKAGGSVPGFSGEKLPTPKTVPIVKNTPKVNLKKPNQPITTRLLPPPPSRSKGGDNGGNGAVQQSTINVVSLVDDKKKDEKGKAKLKHISHYLPAGSFSKVVLLNGINAPTGGQSSQNPVPVLMRIIDNGQMPNKFKSAIRNCHVTGAATGDIASEVAHVRLEKLSCILLNGDVISVNVKGYVAGESGAAGFRGRLVERTGSLLAKGLFAGIAGGLSKNIQQQYQTVSTSALGAITSIDPSKAGQAGLAGGVSSSMEMLAQYYMDRANEIYPIIEVNSKRIGEIVLLDGVDFERDLLANAANK